VIAEGLLKVFRAETNDVAKPYLWSDELFLAYLTEAEEMFCRLTEGLEDATSALTQLTLEASEPWAAISPLIQKIRAASLDTTGAPITVYGAEDAAVRGMRLDGRAGPVRALISGQERHKLRVWPAPHEDTPVTIEVFRLPLQPIVDLDQAPEIDAKHHLPLLHWVKFRAYSKDDVETYDPRKAELNEQRFRAYCAEAKREQGRARHPAGTVAYGGY
jgi:hypothetical protein